MATYESRRYNTPVADATKIADGSVDNTEFQSITSRLLLTGGALTGNVSTTGNISLGDTNEIKIGTSDDLTLAHDGTNSTIQNDTGVLIVSADTVQFKNQAASATFFTMNSATQQYKATLSTQNPSGGSNGDVWYKYS
tara:strand:+ start:1435 stop:1848 length:414 start_codon:yes stop_codon:yes gene_type:complete